MSVPIPTELQHKLIQYTKNRLQINVIEQNNKIHIILDPCKTFSHTKKLP
jgi:hypothetical protein